MMAELCAKVKAVFVNKQKCAIASNQVQKWGMKNQVLKSRSLSNELFVNLTFLHYSWETITSFRRKNIYKLSFAKNRAFSGVVNHSEWMKQNDMRRVMTSELCRLYCADVNSN